MNTLRSADTAMTEFGTVKVIRKDGQSVTRSPSRPRIRLSPGIDGRPARWQRPVLWVVSVAACCGLWELLGIAVDNSLIFPRFSAVIESGWTLFVSEGTVYEHIVASGQLLLVGFLLSLLGIPLGLLIGRNRTARIMSEPVLTALYALPGIALIPLAIIWFGLGWHSKIFIVFLEPFIMIMVTMISGVASLDRVFDEVASAFRISPTRRFFTITVPGSVPFLFTSLRLGIGRALVAVVAVELYAATAGLGFLLAHYASNFQTAKLFVVLGTLSVLGVALTFFVDIFARRIDRWRL